jgi:hypothetical protein
MSLLLRDDRSSRRPTRLESCLARLLGTGQDRRKEQGHSDPTLADWRSRWTIGGNEMAWRLQVIGSQLERSMTALGPSPRFAIVGALDETGLRGSRSSGRADGSAQSRVVDAE